MAASHDEASPRPRVERGQAAEYLGTKQGALDKAGERHGFHAKN